MAKKVFSWHVDAEGSASGKFPVRVVKFGDGYEQRQPTALKPMLREWQVSKTSYKAEIMAISAFFDGCRGVEAFEWESPFGRLLVKVAEYQAVHLGGDAWKLTWKFEEVLG